MAMLRQHFWSKSSEDRNGQYIEPLKFLHCAGKRLEMFGGRAIIYKVISCRPRQSKYPLSAPLFAWFMIGNIARMVVGLVDLLSDALIAAELIVLISRSDSSHTYFQKRSCNQSAVRFSSAFDRLLSDTTRAHFCGSRLDF